MYQIKLIHDLDLDSTLFSGQAFRWYKKNEWYYGYIKNTFVKLRKYNNCIEYMNSENIKFESEIIEYFDLNNNYYKIFENLDDHNAYLAYKRFKGMKVLNQDPWECLISFIISAWSNVPKISKSINDLSIKLGVEKKIDTEVGHTFPTPGILSDLDEKSLRNFSLGYRAKYVLGTSKLLNNNLDLIYDLFNYNYENSLKALLKFPGVGDKVANCVLVYSLKKSYAFPVDLWVERVLVDDYGINKKLSMLKKREWAQNYFGPYSGIIQHFLFHYKRQYNH
tara:strand:- start:7665 stop:8501 length:837 start_codon:yes stop_codon:yes gene_type:complete